MLGGLSNLEVWSVLQPVILPKLAGTLPVGLACAFLCYVLVLHSLRLSRGRYRRVLALREATVAFHLSQQNRLSFKYRDDYLSPYWLAQTMRPR